MAIDYRSIKDGAIKASKLSDGVRKRAYMYERFNENNPHVLTVGSTIAALPTASAGLVSGIVTPAGNYIEWYQTTAQTLHPIGNAKGLVLDGDQVDDETSEYIPGGNVTAGGLSRVVGTDPDFGFRAVFEITDASGSDQFLMGWRKQQANQASTSFLTTGDALYTDFAAIGFCATKANPNPVGVATDLNNSGSTTVTAVSFTWADTKIHQLECRVIARVPQWYINGVRLGGSVSKDAVGGSITAQRTKAAHAFTFDSGDILVPFIFVRQDADLLSGCYLREIEIGDLVDMGVDGPNQR